MADAFDMAAVTAALPDDKKTYNDNPFFGKDIPTAEYDGLTWIQKEKVDKAFDAIDSAHLTHGLEAALLDWDLCWRPWPVCLSLI